MSEQKRVTMHYQYDEDITIEEAYERIADFQQLIKWYADDANSATWLNHAEKEDVIQFVNSDDFNVIYKILKCNGAVFC